MLNNNKTISVTSMLLSLTRFSGSSQMTVYYSQFTKSKALNGSLPWSWIKAPKLYARLDHGDPPSSFRTKEIEYKIASWVDSNQVTLYVITSNILLRSKYRSTVTISMRMKSYSFPFVEEHSWELGL